jgi:hypothetical protein
MADREWKNPPKGWVSKEQAEKEAANKRLQAELETLNLPKDEDLDSMTKRIKGE